MPPMYEKSDDLINHLSRMCHDRGFRLYRHSTGSHLRETKILLMCNHYQTIRCPFLMTYRRPELIGATFILLKYRTEHNHPLIHEFKASDRFKHIYISVPPRNRAGCGRPFNPPPYGPNEHPLTAFGPNSTIA